VLFYFVECPITPVYRIRSLARSAGSRAMLTPKCPLSADRPRGTRGHSCSGLVAHKATDVMGVWRTRPGSFWACGAQGQNCFGRVAHKARTVLGVWHTGTFLVALWHPGTNASWPCVPQGQDAIPRLSGWVSGGRPLTCRLGRPGKRPGPGRRGSRAAGGTGGPGSCSRTGRDCPVPPSQRTWCAGPAPSRRR